MNKDNFNLVEFQGKRDFDRGIRNWYITDKELLIAYAEGERDFKEAHITDGVFNCRNLSDIDLSRSTLTNCQFEKTVLSSASFQDAYIKKCNFNKAWMVYGKFNDVSMVDTTIQRADLHESVFISSSCEACDFSSSDLRGADFSVAILSRANLSSTNCRQTNFQETDLSEAILESANLSKANLWMASLNNTLFSNTSFIHTNFLEASGLYSVFSMTLSSRQDTLYGGIILEDNKIKLRFWAGCQEKVTEAELLVSLEERHGDNAYAKQYKSAIKAIKSMFKNDMAQGKWDYHLTKYKDLHS